LQFAAATQISGVNREEIDEDIDQDNLRIETAKAVARFMNFAQITCYFCKRLCTAKILF